MLRAVSTKYIESQALELFSLARRDVFKVFRRGLATGGAGRPAAAQTQTVLTSSAASTPAPPPPPPPPPHPRRPQSARRAWPAAAAALALTASVGGVYFYRRLSDDGEGKEVPSPAREAAPEEREPPTPATGAAFPEHVQFLLVGAGTAAFAAMRAIRALRPGAQVLLVGEERALPYMRPPLSKELWREPDLAARAADPDRLTFRQWNGKRRSVVYEPSAFYTPVERLASQEHGGVAVARGWRVARLDVARHEAELRAPGREPVTLRYDRCLVATGVAPRRVPALSAAADAGLSLALRGLRDAARLAAKLDEPAVRRVAVVGGGFLACELSAALAERLRGTGKEVVQLVAEPLPMAGVLPGYLAEEAARRLRAAGVRLVAGAELAAAEALPAGGAARLRLRLADGRAESADLAVECVGAAPDDRLAAASGLETHPQLGGLLVNAELQARSDVYAAGDAACFYDVALGRRRVEHHDHAVVSGRLAGENMAAVTPPKHYAHQSMFWSDLGPQLGYEAIGIIDSRLPTVGVFSADAVSDAAAATRAVATEAGAPAGQEKGAPPGPPEGAPSATDEAAARRYERGVVFYLREKRVVGVLLWNLFNRMHVARQVMAQGEFEDLFEVGKLFAPHEED